MYAPLIWDGWLRVSFKKGPSKSLGRLGSFQCSAVELPVLAHRAGVEPTTFGFHATFVRPGRRGRVVSAGQPNTASGRTVRFPFGCRSTTASTRRRAGTS